MFFHLRSRNKESGVVLVTVLMLALTMSIVTLTIFSINISQVTSGKSVIDTIRAEQIAIGGFYRYHQCQMDGLACPNNWVETLDGKQYTVTIDDTVGPGAGPNNTNQIDVDVNY